MSAISDAVRWAEEIPGARKVIDGLRNSDLLLSFRGKIAEAARDWRPGAIEGARAQVESDALTVMAAKYADLYGKSNVLFSIANLILGQPFSQLFREVLIHQDIVTYSRGLLVKVQTVVAAASIVLNESYDRFKDLPENQAALLQLKKSSEKYDFESFVNT